MPSFYLLLVDVIAPVITERSRNQSMTYWSLLSPRWWAVCGGGDGLNGTRLHHLQEPGETALHPHGAAWLTLAQRSVCVFVCPLPLQFYRVRKETCSTNKKLTLFLFASTRTKVCWLILGPGEWKPWWRQGVFLLPWDGGGGPGPGKVNLLPHRTAVQGETLFHHSNLPTQPGYFTDSVRNWAHILVKKFHLVYRILHINFA